ncbi:hypothetical protein [Aromatoleum bremense]|uniref:Uncharacterized protein n=1 Tax=Aromatoleum bremense TaxID=76115 RepID=A0ABX1NZQ5_9RHOO|nr:hypothetical protein [Aromatoleum bremense]NMG16970.1 hypothetical protein [Aromatoleum bremense]QTQ33238.1 Uncharacterized protein pbN1_32520 [Aromatoleum bremense]
MNIPTTRNESWGFFGTIGEHAAAAWPLAIEAIVAATSTSPDGARSFLDSRHGRHFADTVLNDLHQGRGLKDAIDAATRQWMDWHIDRATARDYEIPEGLPYLVGFVIHCEINMQDAG